MPGVRMIGYGCVDATSEAVEMVAEIKKRIEKGVGVFGAKTMLVDPTAACG